MTLGFERFTKLDPDALALVAPSGREWTRGDLSQLVNRVTRALQAGGLAGGQAIAILAPNCAEYAAIYLAGIQAGLAVVPVNWHLAPDEICYILADSQPRALFVHETLEIAATIGAEYGSRARVVCIGEHDGLTSLEQFIAGHSPDPVPPGPDGWMMAYTSATTGRPKAVDRVAVDRAETLEKIARANKTLGILPEDGNVHLCASMMYHSAPLAGVDVALQFGHPAIIAGSWTPELLLSLIDRYRVTTTFMVPSMFIRLLKLPLEVRNRYSTSSLRFLLHGAAPCPPEVKERILDWFGDVVWEAYGSTEASGTIVNSAEWRKYPGTVGRPIHGSAVKIYDAAGNELPPGRVGLVYIRPHTEHFVYKGDEEKTGRAYIGEFLTVGDLGYLNEEGYLFLCGRSGDLIISSGMNIYPAEIETVLVLHPAVTDCAVLPEPHELLGEVPKAFVQLEAGQVGGPRMTIDLLKYLSARLSPMKVPKRIAYVERIPRDPNGKLFKRKLPAARTA